MSAKQVIRVVACVIEQDGKFLITQRKKESHLGHLWEFPGGKIESGESLEDCAIRECQEEIGVKVKPLELLKETLHHYQEVGVHIYFMLCEIVSGKPQVLDCADLNWVSPQNFDNYKFPEADKEIIQELTTVE